MSGQTLKIGTRKSAMALAQTEGIARLLRAADSALDVEIVKFETRGDQDQTSKLLRHGGKGGAFVAEIREAMRAGQLQAAMHSLKDVPGNEETPGLDASRRCCRAMPPTTRWCCVPAFRSTRFALRSGKGFKIGTNAVRRAALYCGGCFPRATVIHYRGAADTRVRKTRSRRQAAASRWRRGGPGGCAGDGAVGTRADRAWRHVSSMISRFAKCCRRWGRASSRSNASSTTG